MVDVVDVSAAFVQFHEVANDLDEVFLRQHGVVGRHGHAEPLVDLVAPHAAEVVALRREEQTLERLFRRLRVRRVARTEQRVDLRQRFLLAVRRILGQRVLDERGLGPTRRDEDADLVDLGLADLLDHRVVEQLAGLGDHFAVGVDDVERETAAHFALAALDRILLVAQVDAHVRREDLDRVDALPAETVEHLFGQLVAFLDEEHVLGALALGLGLLGSGLRRVLGGRFTGKRDVLGDDRAEELTLVGAALALLGQVEVADGEEEAENVRVRPIAEGAQQRGGRELLLLVDVDVHDVVDVDRELDPRAAERDDARRDEALAVRVRRLFEHDARRPVQLADDDALRPVDDERAERREQRQLAEIDLFLDDVARALLLVDDLVDDQLQRRFERRRVRHVALDALLDGVLGFAEGIADELEREVFVDVGDGEQVFEDPLEADVLAIVGGGIQLEQRLEGARLDVQEVGHFHPLVELGERNLLDVRHDSPETWRRTDPPRGRATARPFGGPGTAQSCWCAMYSYSLMALG